MSGPRTLILLGDGFMHRELTRLSESLPWARQRGLSFEVLRGEPQQSVAERRAHERDSPMGFVAADEPSALSALSGGADEAAVYHTFDGPSLAAFVDRIELRARQRMETRRLHAGFAHAEKLTALGTVVAGIGHEINNPLSAVTLCIDAARLRLLPALDAAAELVRTVETGATPSPHLIQKLRGALAFARDEDGAGLFDDMSSAVSAIASIVRDLKVLARAGDDEALDIVNVPELVDHVLRLVGHNLLEHAVIEQDYAEDLPRIVVPRSRVMQVIMNVLVNAAHAMSEIERPVHRLRISIRADEEFVAIAVSDTGPGIPPESLERIFDPFFTTKRQQLGTGLGLSISRAILRELDGDLSVESVYGEGATFVCFLPVPSPEALRAALGRMRAGSYTIPPAAAATVMVVDDDPRMLRSYARLLAPDHRVMTAQGWNDAIELLESGLSARLVLVDLDLADDGGPKLLSWLAEHRPELARRTLILAAAEVALRHAELLARSDGPVLQKPVRGESLLSAIGSLLDGGTE